LAPWSCFSRKPALIAVAVASILAAPAAGQSRRTIAAADTALAAGDIALADSLYYIGVRQRPRDPLVREALGRVLAAQGKTKVAIVLLEEARMFGGDPAQIGRQLAPLYAHIGEWRALLTLPGSPLTTAERRRAGWLAEHPFGVSGDGGAAPIVGTPRGDTIARVAMRVAGRAAVAAIVGTDAGFVAGSRIAGTAARRFGDDSTVIVFDSLTVGQTTFVNVPATTGPLASTMVIGAASLARHVVIVDYRRNRIALARTDLGPAESRRPMIRDSLGLRVLERGRWISLGEYAATVARAAKTLVIDVAAGEVRVRP
jgi:hypothetical protein